MAEEPRGIAEEDMRKGSTRMKIHELRIRASKT